MGDARILIEQKEAVRQRSGRRSAEGVVARAGPAGLRRCTEVGGAAKLGTTYEPVKRQRRRLKKTRQIERIDFFGVVVEQLTQEVSGAGEKVRRTMGCAG